MIASGTAGWFVCGCGRRTRGGARCRDGGAKELLQWWRRLCGDGGAKELLRVNGRTWWPRRFWCSEGVDGVVQGRWWRNSGGTAAAAWLSARLAAAAAMEGGRRGEN